MNKILTIIWNFNPSLIAFGSLDIRWYGLMWALALLGGMLFFENFCKREGLSKQVPGSIFVYGTIATILGARLGHCLFYDPAYFLSRPWEIITGFRDGGMASHGAAFGLLLGLWLFSRKNKLPYIWSLDRVMIPVGLGGAMVRLGNLFNSEIVGRVTDVSWGFKFVQNFRPGTPLEQIPAQHPTQIYEAICYLATFVVLAFLYYKRDLGRRRPGMLFGVGLIGVFLTRFFIEFLKERQVDFEAGMTLDMGQLLSLPFVVLGGYFIYRSLRRPAVEETKVKVSADNNMKKKPNKRRIK